MPAKSNPAFYAVIFGISTGMHIKEITTKPPSPEQQRISTLKSTKDRAADALTAERKRQKVAHAQQSLTAAQQAATNLPSVR
jgi:hypothetical protein